MRETIVAGPVRNRWAHNVCVQALPNVGLDGCFALYLRLMVLIVSAKGALQARWHVCGNRSVNANRTAKNKLLRFSLVSHAKQPLGALYVDFLKISGCRISSATNRR